MRGPPTIVERRLRDLEADGLTRRAPSTVEIEPWPRIQEIFDTGATTYPATYSELTSALVADGSRDPLFAVARAATLASTEGSSFREPRQEFAMYRLDARRSEATLVARVERALDVGGASGQLLRIGSKTYVLFRYGFTFAFEPVLLFGEVPD